MPSTATVVRVPTPDLSEHAVRPQLISVLTLLSLLMSIGGASVLAGSVERTGLGGTTIALVALAVVVVLAQAGVLLFARLSSPVAAYLAVTAGVVVLAVLLDSRSVAATPLYWLALFSMVLHSPRAMVFLAAILGATADTAVQLFLMSRSPSDPIDLADTTVQQFLVAAVGPTANVVVSYAICLAFGFGVAEHRARTRRDRDRIEALDAERSVKVDAAVAAERRRMARELHDVAAHHLAALVIQSRAAEMVGPDDPDQLSSMLTEVRTQGEEALHSLRQIVSVLRLDDEACGEVPQPMMRDIRDLVSRGSPTLASIELDEVGDLDDVGTAVQLTCYRVVQEAMANATRHAPGSRLHVRLERQGGIVTVTVTNTAVPVVEAEDSQGFGLRGLEERADLLAGELMAGPTIDGGWKVRATMAAQAGVTS